VISYVFESLFKDLVNLEGNDDEFASFVRDVLKSPQTDVGKIHYSLIPFQQKGIVTGAAPGGFERTSLGILKGSESDVVMCVVEGDFLHLANVGDSDAILVGKDSQESFFLNTYEYRDKKKQYGLEYQDAEDGGKDRGAFGTSKKSPFYLPFIKQHQLSPDDQALILASDGVWDVVTVEEAANIMRDSFKAGKSAVEAAEAIRAFSVAKGSRDDVTVIVVKFVQEEAAPGVVEEDKDLLGSLNTLTQQLQVLGQSLQAGE